MSTLEDTVRSVVQDFMKNEILFTALDVSNAVKQVLPNTRHREVRDIVRGMFTSDIESQSWARTAIMVTLESGKTAEAMLYHPLSDTWDLDNKYDMQKRSSVSARPHQTAQNTVAQVQSVQTVPATSTVTTAPANTAVVPMPTARTLWDNLFQTQPSLFPSK